jgi:K+-sensing histidine kinase KdpD
MDDLRLSRGVGVALAGLLPIAVAAALVPLRDDLVSTNLALVLVIVVVIGAVVGGRAGGAVAALTAAVSFDFFLTEPYLSLHIESADDIETTILLLVVGLLVGQIAVWAQRNRTAAERGRSEIHRLVRIADLIARGENAADVLLAAQAELTELLDLDACRFEAAPSGTSLAHLERTGAVTGQREWRFAGHELALPAAGVELPVLHNGRAIGRFVLTPRPGVGASLEARVVGVAIADQVGSVLAGTGANHE